MLWLVSGHGSSQTFICSPCLFRVDNKVFICFSVPGWSLWSGFNRPTFWMVWSRCDVTHISWRKHQQATSSTIYSTSCWIKEVVMRSPISFDTTTRPSVECQMWDVMSKRVNIMMFYLTIGSTYFVKTRTYVALFCPHELSIIFSGVMYLEL